MGNEEIKIEGNTKASYKTVESQRLDSATFKKEQFEVYQKYLKKNKLQAVYSLLGD